ncbi:MAG: DUF4388 domain-containing protein [Thermoanaerobaculia bacterium]
MGLVGTLGTMSPGDLLQWLSLAQKTGTLVVRSRTAEKKVILRNGRIVSTASNDPREYLGQFLMSHGYISEDELKKAMEVQLESRILLGKILAMINAISEKDLTRLMRLKAEETIYDIFLWNGGEFEFQDDVLPTMEMVPLDIDVTGIVMEGMRRVDEWSRIRELIPDGSMIPVRSDSLDPDQLRERERMIALSVDGQRSIEQIVLESRSSEFVVCKTIYDLVSSGKMAVRDHEEKTPREQLTGEIFLSREAEIRSRLDSAQVALGESRYDEALQHLRAASNLDPENQAVRNTLHAVETRVHFDLERKGIALKRTPRIAKEIEEIGDMNFTPNEGFVLSRINGMWDIGSIIKISPIRETEALLIFSKLLDKGIIDFKP